MKNQEGVWQFIIMAQITMKSGHIIEFDPLKYDQLGLIKIRAHNEGNDSEGIWAVVSQADKVKYNDNKQSGYFVAMLANSSVYFALGETWGMHVVAKFMGHERPSMNWNWVDYNKKENRIFSEEVPEDKRY